MRGICNGNLAHITDSSRSTSSVLQEQASQGGQKYKKDGQRHRYSTKEREYLLYLKEEIPARTELLQNMLKGLHIKYACRSMTRPTSN